MSLVYRNLLIMLIILLPSVAIANPMACGAYLCLSQDEYPQQECSQYRQAYFAIAIYSPYFNDAATYAARLVYMLTCPHLPAVDPATAMEVLMQIMAEYGYEETDPDGA